MPEKLTKNVDFENYENQNDLLVFTKE